MNRNPSPAALPSIDEMPRPRSMSTDTSHNDSADTQEWDDRIEIQAHRLARRMSNSSPNGEDNGNTASSQFKKVGARSKGLETRFPVIIGGKSLFKTAADVQHFCQLQDPPGVDIASESGLGPQTSTSLEYETTPPQSNTHIIAYLNGASFRRVEDRSQNERISIWMQGEITDALLPLSIKPPPFLSLEARRASAMKFKGKTRSNDAEAIWEAAVRNLDQDHDEITYGLVILGEGSMFKTAQELADYFAWLDAPPVCQVTNIANRKPVMVCEISETVASTLQDILLYQQIAVEFKGESMNALLPMTVSPCWQVTPKPPMLSDGVVFFTRPLEDESPGKASNHPGRCNVIDNLTRPDRLYPLIIRKAPGEEDLLNSSDANRSMPTVVHTWETTVYPQPKPGGARTLNRHPAMRFHPSVPIVYVTLDCRRKVESRGPGVNEVIWLKNHPMFAWRSFDFEFNLDWEQYLAELAEENKDQSENGVTDEAWNDTNKSTDSIAAPRTIGWPRVERSPVGRGMAEQAHDPTPSQTTVADIRRNRKKLRSAKAIDTCELAGPHTGTDAVDWAERAAVRDKNYVENHVEALETAGKEFTDEFDSEVHEEVHEVHEEADHTHDEEHAADGRRKKSASWKSRIKRLLGFSRRG
ncbi:hypothetical protein V8F20_005109 [Naviculisporaceae sp. PSN 640]